MNKGNLLAKVKPTMIVNGLVARVTKVNTGNYDHTPGGLGVVDTLNLDETSVRMRRVLVAPIPEMAGSL